MQFNKDDSISFICGISELVERYKYLCDQLSNAHLNPDQTIAELLLEIDSVKQRIMILTVALDWDGILFNLVPDSTKQAS